MRQEFPRSVKAAAFLRANGRCEDCTARLVPGKFQYDHDLADGLGGLPTLENCVVRCSACHGAKTASRDVPQIAKLKRVRDNHAGARTPSRSPLPFGRSSPLKRKMDGSIVRRNAHD